MMRPTRLVKSAAVQKSFYSLSARLGLFTLIFLCFLWLVFSFTHYQSLRKSNESYTNADSKSNDLLLPLQLSVTSGAKADSGMDLLPLVEWRLSHAFDNLLYRAREKKELCAQLDPQNNVVFDQSTSIRFIQNETVATLPAFGIIQDITNWKDSINAGILPSSIAARDRNDPAKWQCLLPPRKECRPTRFSVVFMAYNPDRLKIMLDQIKMMLTTAGWTDIVKSVVLVWNGPKEISESEEGRDLLEFHGSHVDEFFISYPLKMGFSNDLMNRYHPDVIQNVSTKAILYYDDDGPFYSLAAIQAGFELWKRHPAAQIGAMARHIDYGSRQQAEFDKLTASGTKHNDRLFISHCDNLPEDVLEYNYKYFANYDANMVLPSGSFLHTNYLCFLWHPVLENVRKFVREHPAHPDDMTVSWIVSQLAGRAPRVYSRRLKPPEATEKKRRRLSEETVLPDFNKNDTFSTYLIKKISNTNVSSRLKHPVPFFTNFHSGNLRRHNRNLMLNINWDAGAGMTDAKRYWAALRSVAVNSLARYFGSINSGSIGWCQDTGYYNPKVPGKCDPVMARQGWLPWMIDDYEHSC